MTRVVLVLAAVMIALGISATGNDKQAPEKKPVKAEGCVEQGVEASCLLVKDVKSNKLYNIFTTGRLPEVGKGIEFTGAPHEGPTSCMQGVAVDVIKWAPKSSLKCSPKGTVEK